MKLAAVAVLGAAGATVACLNIDSRSVEVDDSAGQGNGAKGGSSGSGGKGGSGGTGGAKGGSDASGGTTGGSKGGSDSAGGTGGASGGASGTGGAGGSTGGDASSGKGGSAGGTGGTDAGGTGNAGSATAGMGGTGGVVTCTAPRDELTIDGSHWMPRQCSDYEIQGAWYCYDDEVADCDCDNTPTSPRWDTEVLGYCLSGTTILDTTYAAWGAGMAFELNNDPETGKYTYDALGHNIIGFALTVEGLTSGNVLRIGYTDSLTITGVSPFVEFAGLDNETRILYAYFADANVPSEWDDPNAGKTVDGHAVMDVQLQIVGAMQEAPYQFCITHVVPILDAAR